MTDAKRIVNLESQVSSLRARLAARTDQLLLVLLQIDDLKRAAPGALAATAPAPAASGRLERCPHCDDTGDVHSITGEWRGVCSCDAAGAPAASGEPGRALAPTESAHGAAAASASEE